MSPRREFLLALFRILDERGVEYCVLRNFDEVLEDGGSDVDLLTRPADVSAVQGASGAAAIATGFRLVQRTRFVNYSAVFWDGAGGFVRLDLDTEVRWRCWLVLTAEEILAERRRRGPIFVPTARHEVAILRAQMVWRGGHTERYVRRLSELGSPVEDVAAMRHAIVRQNLLRPQRWLNVVVFLTRDLARWRARWNEPPGAVLEIFSARPVDTKPLLDALTDLFPAAKSAQFFARKSGQRIVFKGGLAIRCHSTPPQALRPFTPRTFVAVVEGSGRTHIADVAQGEMAALPSLANLPQFILEVCAKEFRPPPPPHRGTVLALVGLDGAGKTTFARQLCAEVGRGGRFPSVHYCHWIPALDGTVEFPWPQQREIPRKGATKRHPGAMLLSAIRLAKNLILARLAWRWRVQPWLQSGHLVLLDRFLYNYWLDPDSVRSVAPPRWLEWLRIVLPKPDLLVTLMADAETLLARKKELSSEEVAEQTRRLQQLPTLARRRVDLDARQSPEQLAAQIMQILKTLPQ